MRQETDRHSADLLFVLLIFAGFLLTSLLLISLGSREYRQVVNSMQENDEIRIAGAYLAQKIRNNRTEDGISIGEIHGTECLELGQEIGGKEYVTYLYVREGKLCELFSPSDPEDLTLAAGTQVLDLAAMELEETSSRDAIRVTLTAPSGRSAQYIFEIRP